VACRNVHVARPRASTSGGQWAGSVAGGSGDRKPAPDASAAIISEVDFLCVVGRQLRKAVQILQGLPSGPRTMPGGNEGLGGVGVGCDRSAICCMCVVVSTDHVVLGNHCYLVENWAG
jgi:hypothetical protein